MTIEEKYQAKCNHPSDINQLLPHLREYALKCSHITEMGVRDPTSTYAFLSGLHGEPGTLICYDIERSSGIDEAEELTDLSGIEFQFILKDVLLADIEETDFLFIDTHHTARQLTAELALHADRVKKFIGFHDTETFWNRDESEYKDQPQEVYGEGPGLKAAIEPFLANNPEWQIDFQTPVNNGLMILKRATF